MTIHSSFCYYKAIAEIFCADGKTHNITGSSSSEDCNLCPEGTYSANGNLCELCPAGYASTSSRDNCSACKAGRYSEEGMNACQSCSKGKYSEHSKQTDESTCKLCPSKFLLWNQQNSLLLQLKQSKVNTSTADGKTHNITASSSREDCEFCAAGQYLTDGNLCEPCPAGYTTNSSHDGCDECQEGQYSKEGMRACQNCSEGKYSEARGESSCKPCSSKYDTGISFRVH